MAALEKTNTMRLLDSLHVTYQVHTFSSEIHSANEVAITLGIPAERVYKTLVVLPPKGKPILAIVPGNAELDLKKLAAVVGEKSCVWLPRSKPNRSRGCRLAVSQRWRCSIKGSGSILIKAAVTTLPSS